MSRCMWTTSRSSRRFERAPPADGTCCFTCLPQPSVGGQCRRQASALGRRRACPSSAGAYCWGERVGFRNTPTSSSPFQEYGADVDRFTGQLLACRALLRSRLEIAPCAALSVHHMWVRGTGAHIAARTAQATWLGAGLGAQARLHARPWLAVTLGAFGEVETSRPRLSVENAGRVEQLLPVAATLNLGTEWIF
jgi:hypothetical protein